MAYPFQPVNNQTLKIMTELNKSRNDKDSNCFKKDCILPDNIHSETNHPILDRFHNHFQTNRRREYYAQYNHTRKGVRQGP